MAKDPKRLVAGGFILAAVLSAIAAGLPLLRGRPLNAAFVAPALVFLVFGVVKWRTSSLVERSGPDDPRFRSEQ